MAFSVEQYGPSDRNPEVWRGELQWGRLVDDGTATVFAGSGVLGHVNINAAVASETVEFHDTIGTPDSDSLVLEVATDAIGEVFRGRILLSEGLKVVTSAASIDVTFEFLGRSTVSARQFGI